MRFKDKVILVTGASQNTGMGIAAKFLKEGAKVCINSSSLPNLQVAEEALHQMGLSGFLKVPADISNNEEVALMFGKIAEAYGRIDILVNNACDQGMGAVFEEMIPEDFLRVVRINLFGTFQVSQYAVRMMLKQESRGVIVNMGSNVSMRAIHNRTAYIASKGGIDALTRSMATDLGPKGIRVNTVAPGYIHTDRWSRLSPEVIRRRRLNTALGSEATIEDIAETVAFLASDSARNICGERLVVDAGCSAQHLPIDVDQ